MIRVTAGRFDATDVFLKKLKKGIDRKILMKYGEMGVKALENATPIRSGKTAHSWSYEIVPTSTGCSLVWNNSNINKGMNVAILIQYGHGTRSGTYVEGIDYINPAMKPVFNSMATELGKEVFR